MNIKKIISICIILGILLIISGSVISMAISTEKEQKDKKYKPFESYEISNDKMKSEHCYEDVCIEDLKIHADDPEFAYVTAYIYNNSSEKSIFHQGYQVLLQVNSNVYSAEFYIDNLEKNSKVFLDSIISKDVLNYNLENIDYSIVKMSESDLKKYTNS